MSSHPAPKAVYLKDYKAPDFRAQKVDLLISLHDDGARVTSTVAYAKENPSATSLILNGECMDLSSVTIDGRKLEKNDYHSDDHSLTIINPPEKFLLEIVTTFDPAKNTALEGLYKSGGNYCTQCEAEGFRRITYYQDRPDVMAPFTTRIEADRTSCPVLLSNGNLVEEGHLSGGRHFAVWEDPRPKSCYLFALVAGKLDFVQDYFVTRSGRKVDLRIYVRPPDIDQCGHAMASLKRAMKWDEDVYGREYHLDRFNIVAISDFNMGAMENTSLNIFNSAFIMADPELSTDLDFYHVEAVVAHEYFHNWTGNRVTCRDWFQLSLKEGLTVYREHEFSADMYSRSVQRIDDAEFLRSTQFPEDGGPLAHPVRPDHYYEINNFYTTTVYEKGSEVVRMQATLLGPEVYRKATDLYFERHDGQAVTCDDFVSAMEDASGFDLSQFKLWYSQAGTPEVTATTKYVADERKFELTLSQHIPDTPSQSDKKPMVIPVEVGLLNENGAEIVPTQVLHLKDKSETFIFEGVSSRPIPSLLRDFSAPVRLVSDLSENDLRLLMVHDTDGFNRWDSSQILALRLIGRMIDATESGHMAVTDHAFLDAIHALLEQIDKGGQDLALLSRMLSLPDFSIIAQERAVIEPDHIHLVTTRIKNDVLENSGSLIKKLYDRLNVPKEYSPDHLSMAERSLKSVLLSYLTCRKDAEASVLAKDLYDQAGNMTDRMMALAVLADTQSPERDAALSHFYDRFKHHELVVNKWFRVQAQAIRPTTIEDIKTLSERDDFIITNPNRVRSVFGTLSLRNPVIFHKKDGSGYELFAALIEKLDPINPQTTARLLTAFENWRRFDPLRQKMISEILRTMLESRITSPNSFEIISKMLGS